MFDEREEEDDVDDEDEDDNEEEGEEKKCPKSDHIQIDYYFHGQQEKIE